MLDCNLKSSFGSSLILAKSSIGVCFDKRPNIPALISLLPITEHFTLLYMETVIRDMKWN